MQEPNVIRYSRVQRRRVIAGDEQPPIFLNSEHARWSQYDVSIWHEAVLVDKQPDYSPAIVWASIYISTSRLFIVVCSPVENGVIALK